ncbi:hypothetical protein E8E13_004899 [Curvularia kusanoi]|uniref:Uncharacterized protein n=1 Tax=Curvularia kusanoi TaxID=90978 RepID=A0A9P4TJQ9_CURKU|nr:hypothetical protein E8E13_004899 [Curvularia kusanoi]
MALSTRRSGTRGLRANSNAADTVPSIEAAHPARIPHHYYLPPTVPSPFYGTLEASLDAILEWGLLDAATTPVKEALLQVVSTSTNWPQLLNSAFGQESSVKCEQARFLLEELLFLITRTLLPEQIAENRAAMGRLYNRKKHLAIRLVLRYDMVREWMMGEGPVSKRDMSVLSVPPTIIAGNSSALAEPVDTPMDEAGEKPRETVYKRRELMPNVWPTLIAAPSKGYPTHGVKDRMKHYITPLDNYLLLTDEEVSQWSDKGLIIRISQIVLQWQWLRQSNETLEEMEIGGWKELDGKAEECEWVAEKKEGGTARGGRSGEEN